MKVELCIADHRDAELFINQAKCQGYTVSRGTLYIKNPQEYYYIKLFEDEERYAWHADTAQFARVPSGTYAFRRNDGGLVEAVRS